LEVVSLPALCASDTNLFGVIALLLEQLVAPSVKSSQRNAPLQQQPQSLEDTHLKIMTAILFCVVTLKETTMLTLRKSAERGYADHGWLKSFHSFSFAGYYDAAHMGFGNLRVINEDRIAPGTGFGTHGHTDMEIISYVLSGNLGHTDSLGNIKGIPPGDVQRMSAGRGVRHSELNHAANQETHFLQIWIEPNQRGIEPSYEQKHVSDADKRGQLCLIASPIADAKAVKIFADAHVYAGLLDTNESATLTLDANRLAYVHVVRGSLDVNGQRLHSGDAAKLANEAQLSLSNGVDAEVLVFDLAP
jgi:quercetin 2,3-dioxygenase